MECQTSECLKPQFTSEENLFARSINQKEIHFFELDPTSDSTVNINQPSFKYKVNDPKATLQAFQISPGRNPSVAIFIPENQVNLLMYQYTIF